MCVSDMHDIDGDSALPFLPPSSSSSANAASIHLSFSPSFVSSVLDLLFLLSFLFLRIFFFFCFLTFFLFFLFLQLCLHMHG